MARQSGKNNGARLKSDDDTSSKSKNGDHIEYVDLSTETRRRYLNYALSVIQSRALPDVRDGLKPVQRRILYVMFHDLHLAAGSKPRKCRKICGDTTGNYHPHGAEAVYDALVRLAQDFTFRYPLVDGQGNFGSVIGLPPAADRYTEARLMPIASEIMSELRFRTVDTRPNFEATMDEPVVLPSRFPNILVNGCHGIAVGMATSMPPHNLGEVIKACIHIIHTPKPTVAQVMKFIKGPDFPLGGRIVTDRRTLRQTYEEGRGPIKVRGEWRFDRERRKEQRQRLVIYSIPYDVRTGPLLTDIGDIIENKKLPQLESVADESDEKHGMRIVLEIRPDADPEAVVAYLYKHTNLENNFSYNATCLVPDEHGVLVPARVNLVDMLQYFLDFRFTTVRKRFEFQLEQLENRIHILEGFAIVFRGLDKALKIIRRSSGKQDAAKKLMREFLLDEVQTNAILELQLYRISRLEIDQIKEQLKEKRADANRIRRILASNRRLWSVVESELKEVSNQFADRRRTSLGSSDEITEFDAQAYIVRENTNVVVTREGWLKRAGRLNSVKTTRVRDGDSVLSVAPGSTLDNVVLFASDGVAYTMPIDQVPASSGYGDPMSKHVRWGDGVNLITSISTDPRFTPADKKKRGEPTPAPFLLIATANGQIMRISFSQYRLASTKAGRKFCRLRKGDRVVYAALVRDAKTAFLATKKARIIHFSIKDALVLTNPGIGVRGIKLESDDKVLGAVQLSRPSDCLRVENTNGKVLAFGQMKYNVTSRGGKGVKTSHRSGFESIIHPPIDLVDWNEIESE